MQITPFPLPSEVFITNQLAARTPGEPDYLEEKLALQRLVQSMVDTPDHVLSQLVDLAMKVTGSSTAGLSIFEGGQGSGVFRWHHLKGKLAAFNGATTPRNYSPCGVTLDCRQPVLVQYPENIYTWLQEANISLPEVLLVPLYVGEHEPLGTLWVVTDNIGELDSGHARILVEQATFVGIALRMQRTDQKLRQALDQQETLAREMNHRVKNVFAVVSSLIRFGARGAKTPAEMAETVTARVAALASAHSLVLGEADGERAADIQTLIAKIVEPHNHPQIGSTSRLVLKGALVTCGEKMTNGIALVVHELATNAVKYGALSTTDGEVKIGWQIEGSEFILRWSEQSNGAPAFEGERVEGFGSKLIRNTVAQQFGGTLDHDWRAEGLAVTIRFPAAALTH